MSLLNDRPARRYLLAIAVLCAAGLLACLLFCHSRVQAAQAMLLQREQVIAGALLERGVSEETVAAALACEEDGGLGQMLLSRIGRTRQTPPRLLTALRDFESSLILWPLTGGILTAAALFLLAWRFLAGREQLYLRAEKTVRRFSQGDFHTRLPHLEEGALARLYAAVDDLAAALQAKSEAEHQSKEFLRSMTADISHQLKTPLAALRMYQEIILEDAADPAVVTVFSQKTGDALGRMESLIQALLKITRLDAGGIIFSEERISIAELVRQAAAELSTRAAREGKTLRCSGPAAQTLLCDAEWTREALGNLIKNALDHTQRGGRIDVTWKRSAAVARITVADDGCGIAPEDLHHIFKRFYRSRNSLDSQGVGLGLPLAKSIIEGQGGVLSVQSAPGQGAAFTIAFLTQP